MEDKNENFSFKIAREPDWASLLFKLKYDRVG